MRGFWWRPGNGRTSAPWTNAGDELTPLLLDRFAGITAEWSPAAVAEVVVVGSIATMLHQYRGSVLGIGKARETPIDLSRADVRAVRGPLTLRGSGVGHTVALGDPGLLSSLLYDERPETFNNLGVVGHWQDKHLAGMYPGALIIDVRRKPEQVIAEIASCERIVSSSLHGIIIADAFGIPRRWAWFDKVQGRIGNGGSFKFSDHNMALGMDAQPGVWMTAPRQRVEQAQSDLREAFATWAAQRMAA